MCSFFLEMKGSPESKVQISKEGCIVGKSPDVNFPVQDPYLSGRHVQFVLKDNGVWIEDLNSTNGTFLDNKPFKSGLFREPLTIKAGTNELLLSVEREDPVSEPDKPEAPPVLESAEHVDSLTAEERDFKSRIFDTFTERMDRAKVVGEDNDQLRERVVKLLEKLLAESPLSSGIDAVKVRKSILADVLGMGPLEPLLDDDSITEIMVNSESDIFIERGGRIVFTDVKFRDRAQLLHIIEKIVSPIGRRIDESSPMVDARLPDGSRVNAVIPPLALDGPSITIRKFGKKVLGIQDLINWGALTETMGDLLESCVKNRLNILISGGTGSGKTTLLNVLSSFIPDSERIVTIEDSAELRLNQHNIVRLEARPANMEGKGRVSIRDLVINALRMRPDRIVVGECRGGEALDMVQAMNTGHDGSITTAHANSPRDLLRRLEVMCLMAGMDIPIMAIREQVVSAVDMIVQISRFKDGSRKVVKITDVTGMEGEKITLQDIFEYRQEGFDKEGKVVGQHAPTGNIPAWVEALRASGVDMDLGMFRNTG